MPAEIRLLATDLDGTVVAAQGTDATLSAFAEEITSLRSRFGTQWAVFSGRSKHRVLKLLAPLRDRNVSPDFVILKYIYLYRLTKVGYVPCLRRNAAIFWRLLRGPAAACHVLNDWYESNVDRLREMRTLIRSEHRLRLRFEKDEDAVAVARTLVELLDPYCHLRVLHTENEVDVTPVPYLKGLVLAELSRILGIDRQDILAIGNGRNDLSMIDSRVAAMCGCPANSDARIIQAVYDAGGHLAKKRSIAGVSEIIDAYVGGTVRSELPADWRPPRREMSMPERPWGMRPARKKAWQIAVAVAVAYLVLLIFAGFDLLPYSEWIRKPYEWAVWTLARLFR